MRSGQGATCGTPGAGERWNREESGMQTVEEILDVLLACETAVGRYDT